MKITLEGEEAENYYKNSITRITGKRSEHYDIAFEFEFRLKVDALVEDENLLLIFATFDGPLKQMGGKLIKKMVNKSNHSILIIVSIPVTKSPAEAAKLLKMVSSRLVKKFNPELEQHYDDEVLWSRYYGIVNPGWSKLKGFVEFK